MTDGRRGPAYCRGALKRGFDLVLSCAALVILSPLLGLIALLVLVTSGRPLLFRQERVGRDGRPFRIAKFRSMRLAPGGPEVTARDDARVTRIGRLLRATKADELPQLLNVARGEMSIVGPRPEVPRYVALYTPAQRRVLAARPGLTDPASIRYRDEERLLASVTAADRERYYREELLPRKLDLNLAYVDGASLALDLRLIGATVLALLRPARR